VDGTPLVRCTQDGWSAVVGRDGRVLAELPLAPAPRGTAAGE
jgi:apolipoprotein N-acyltransferase